ncbi:MAG TPA: septum formation initiator family protein [Balneolaceae bacterium]|nr:septum formation initiator family protein [Balneolaceae bacterium]
MNLQVLNPLRWRKSFLITILVAFILVWILFIDTYSLYTRYELHQKKNELIERTSELKAETASLEEKIKELTDNADLLEKIAREEYGMRKPGETVYRIK